MLDLGFLGAETSADFQVDPELVKATQAAQDGQWGDVTALAATGLCTALGVSAMAAPACAAVGRWIGNTFVNALNAGRRGYEEQVANQNAITRAGNYLIELKNVRDQALQRTVDGLVQFGKQNGWSQANPTDVAVQLSQLGANITNVADPSGTMAKTNQLPSGVLISTATLGSGGPYFSGPLPCSGTPPHHFLKCTGGSCGPGGKGQWVVNNTYMQCMVDQTNKWGVQLSLAAAALGTAILDHKAPGQINFSAPIFTMKNSSSTKMSTTTKVVGGAAVLGGGWWLLTKLGWL